MNAKIYERATRAMLREARKLGKRKGEGAADVQHLIVTCPPDWLSGEWADEPTVQDIAERCGVNPERDQDGEVANEIADAFCAAADAAWSTYLLRHLREVAKGGR